MRIQICWAVITSALLLTYVESLAFRAASYTDSEQNQVFKIHSDFKLVGHVFETSIVDEFDCGLRCVRDGKCLSYNHNGDKSCELNDQIGRINPVALIPANGFTYYEKEGRRGFHPSNPGRSCMDLRKSEHSLLNGEYWIDPEGNRNPMKVYCDMTTDDGGWLLVANLVTDGSTPPWTAESSYRGISNFANNKMFITTSAMKELRAHFSFTQLRFHCSKQKGRTFHVTTAANASGRAVVQYFSGQTDMLPDSCGSFQRMKGDNSKLAVVCEDWGFENGHLKVGKWGHSSSNGENRLYAHTAYVASTYYWLFEDSYWYCDDMTNDVNLTAGDFWKIYLR